MSKESLNTKRVIKDFIREFELEDPNLYKVAYSPLTPSDVLMIGDSPGGDPCRPETVANYKEEYRDGDHDFLDEHYRLAVRTRDLFKSAFGSKGHARLRHVQVTNASFFRSPGRPSVRETRSNREKCRPYLTQLMEIVDPILILANSMDVFRYLKGHLGNDKEIDRALPPPASGQQIYYRKVRGRLGMLGGKDVDLVGFHHLSGYRWSTQKFIDLAIRIRRDWPT